MLVARVDLYVENFAVLDAVGRRRREQEFLVADLAVAHVLFDHRAIVQHPEVGAIHDDPGLEQRAEEREHLVHACHRRGQGMMPRHPPGDVRVKQLLANRFHIPLAKAVVHPKHELGVVSHLSFSLWLT